MLLKVPHIFIFHFFSFIHLVSLQDYEENFNFSINVIIIIIVDSMVNNFTIPLC